MFYIGIVEDNNDPLKLGRLKVRVYGLNTDNRNNASDYEHYLPVDDLQWAFPIFPVTNSNIDGISDFGGIVNGTKVAVIYMDNNKQQPFYLGVLPFTLDNMPDFEKGFSDPLKEHPQEDYKNESSISRLARNENINKTCIKKINDNRRGWKTNGIDFEEPESAYNAKYPFNRVIETESGIIVELDSTPNNERIHIYHPSGSYEEIRPDGSKVVKNKGVEILVDEKSKAVSIGGNYSLRIGAGVNVEIDGDAIITTNDKLTLNTKKDVVINSESENGIGIISNSKLNVQANEVNIKSPVVTFTAESNNPNITVKNNATVNVINNVDITAGGNVNLTSSGITKIQASMIQLN